MPQIISTEEIQIDGIVYIRETYDTGHVVECPKNNPVEQEPQQETVTLEDLQAQINELQEQSTTTSEQVAEMYAVQAGDVVVKSELDAAYREGVNSYE